MTEQEILAAYPQMTGGAIVRDKRYGQSMELSVEGGLAVLKFPKLKECAMVEHLFTTRFGGVSTGHSATMNFSRNLGDTQEAVLENYKRVAKALGTDAGHIVATDQTHTTNIRKVTIADAGKGVVEPADYQDVDGLVTNVPGIVLSAYGADCCTLYFVDPVGRAIGLAHAGWRGTVGDMAGKMVRKMQEEYQTNPEDLLVAIGPSVCRDCYEVDEKVAVAFRDALGDYEKERTFIDLPGEVLHSGRMEGKYQLDLWYANLVFLCRAGVKPTQVSVTDICTNHNPQLLFSHRFTAGKRGNMGAFLKIKEEG